MNSIDLGNKVSEALEALVEGHADYIDFEELNKLRETSDSSIKLLLHTHFLDKLTNASERLMTFFDKANKRAFQEELVSLDDLYAILFEYDLYKEIDKMAFLSDDWWFEKCASHIKVNEVTGLLSY